MNERIKQLAEQARRDSFGKIENPQNPTEWSKYHDTFEQKFAELIVRECGKSCTLQGDEDDMFRKFGIKHFGVEE